MRLPFLALLALTVAACGRTTEAPEPLALPAEQPAEDAPNAPASPMAGFATAMGEMMGAADRAGGERVETVDFRALRDRLPERLADRTRTDASGERSGMGGFTVSRAEASYASDDGSTLRVRVVDIGGIGNFAFLGAAWLMAEVDRESDRGFERTTRFEGYRAFEKEERRGERLTSELQVVVADRFLVSLEGRGVEAAELRAAAAALDLRGIERLGTQG